MPVIQHSETEEEGSDQSHPRLQGTFKNSLEHMESTSKNNIKNREHENTNKAHIWVYLQSPSKKDEGGGWM